MNKAVFLDRDGVINPLIYNPDTSEYESPHYPEDFSIYPYVIKSLKLIKGSGYKIILVSNQRSYAKGKTSLENIKAIEELLKDFSTENGGLIDEYYYCYHHPNGVMPEYTVSCRCRKPDTLFLEEAVKKFDLDITNSYFIGDQDTDIQCGKAMGVKTIKINNKHTIHKSGKEMPDEFAADLYAAALKVIKPNS
jgi:D-glycero-D-manno-heptose 1,7-bisphosphate phosphatase